MKKAIHIAGSIIGVIVVYALAIAALAQNPPARSRNATNKWHRATYKECSDEAHRELAETGKEGIIGDAPITVGSADGTVGIEGWSYDPCGYADNSNPPHFKARYTHWTGGGKETEITEREYQKHEGKDNLRAQPPTDNPKLNELPNQHYQSDDIVCSVGNEFVPCPPQKVQAAPFDVPAVTIDKWEPPLPKVDSTRDSTTIVQCEVPDLSEWVCDFHGIFHHHIQKTTCADTSRYLLHSEDGKAHCLKLVPHD